MFPAYRLIIAVIIGYSHFLLEGIILTAESQEIQEFIL